MSEATARPQDLGRPHRRARPGPTPETAAILERYRAAMRAELAYVLDDLGPFAQLAGDAPIVFGEEPPRGRPALAERVKLWDLAIKLGRELGAPGLAELEEEPAPASSSTPRPPARAPRLSARERRSLGG